MGDEKKKLEQREKNCLESFLADRDKEGFMKFCSLLENQGFDVSEYLEKGDRNKYCSGAGEFKGRRLWEYLGEGHGYGV